VSRGVEFEGEGWRNFGGVGRGWGEGLYVVGLF